MDIWVATTTFYKSVDDLRLELTLKTLNALHDVKISAAVVDGSLDDEIKKRLKATGAIVIEERPDSTMGDGRRLALSKAGAASTDHVVFWMEPEKYPMVPFIHQICAPIYEDEADIVVPRRADELSSYPMTQRLAEQCGNAIFEAVSGLALDVWIGPRAINVKGLAHFAKYDGTYGDKWQSIFMPLLTAAKDGLRLTEVVVDYVHPPEQTEAENKDTNLSIVKRLEQLHELGNALVQQAQAIGLTSS
jgi:hypothetical protein